MALKNNFDIFLACCLGISWLIFIKTAGIGLYADSTHYITYALDIYHNFRLSVDPIWPPAYPLAISLVMFISEFPAEATAILSGIYMWLFLIGFTLILRQFGRQVLLNSLFLITLFTFIPILTNYTFASTESLFFLSLILNFYWIIKHHHTQNTSYYFLGAITATLAALTRYIGYSLIITFFIYTLYLIVISIKKHTQPKYIVIYKYLILNTIAAIPVIMYMIRNYSISQTFHGHRMPSEYTLWQNLYFSWEVLISDLTFSVWLLLITASLLSFLIYKSQSPLKKISLPIFYIILFMMIYLIMLFYSTSQIKLDIMSTRYLSPLYICLFILIFISFNEILMLNSNNHYFYQYSGPKFLYSLILVASLIHTTHFINFINPIIKKYGSPAYHYNNVGFNLSRTAREMKIYLDEIFSQSNPVYISVVDRYNYNNASALLLRNIYNNLTVKNLAFKTVKVYNSGLSLDFKLAFFYKNIDNFIIYKDLYRPSTTNQFLKILHRLFFRDIKSLWLIIDKGWITKDLSKLSNNYIKITYQRTIEPYKFYQVRPIQK
jgi:hypothetical protein